MESKLDLRIKWRSMQLSIGPVEKMGPFCRSASLRLGSQADGKDVGESNRQRGSLSNFT